MFASLCCRCACLCDRKAEMRNLLNADPEPFGLTLSFSCRDWFVVDDPIVRLRAELLAERMLRQRAEDRFHAAETARRAAERERDLYRVSSVALT